MNLKIKKILEKHTLLQLLKFLLFFNDILRFSKIFLTISFHFLFYNRRIYRNHSPIKLLHVKNAPCSKLWKILLIHLLINIEWAHEDILRILSTVLKVWRNYAYKCNKHTFTQYEVRIYWKYWPSCIGKFKKIEIKHWILLNNCKIIVFDKFISASKELDSSEKTLESLQGSLKKPIIIAYYKNN